MAEDRRQSYRLASFPAGSARQSLICETFLVCARRLRKRRAAAYLPPRLSLSAFPSPDIDLSFFVSSFARRAPVSRYMNEGGLKRRGIPWHKGEITSALETPSGRD